MNENNQRPRRNIFLSFLPYIFIIGAIVGFVFLIFGPSWNKGQTWSYSDLDTKLVQYEVRNASATSNYKITVLNGTAFDPTTNRKTEFTVTIPNEVFDDNFYIEQVDTTKTYEFPYYIEGDQVWHVSYREQINKEINDYKTQNPTANDAYFTINNAFEVSWWDSWGPTIIMLVVTVIIAFVLFGRLSRTVNGANSKALDFNNSRAKKVENSKIRFADVAGCDEEKAEMVEVVEYLKDPTKYSKFGAKLPKGILLVGPPGTGKTLLAKAVAGEAGVPFYSISGSDFVEMFVGVGAGRVRDMFRKAKASAPCLIFIDEIDAVGRQRGAGLGGGNDEREQTLNQLLVEMDGFSDNAGIIVMAATNRDDVLDPALLRAGRFDRQITVSLPDKKGREEIFKVHARNKQIDSNVDFAQLAKRTVGFSGADIENIMNEAAILAVRLKHDKITVADIDEAIDRRIAGPAKSSRSLTEIERKTIAYHEAGHAIIGLTLPHSDKVQKITIIPRGRTGGHVLMAPEDDRFLLTKNELVARIIGYLGGRSSEEIFFNDISTGAHNDIEVATRIARLMVTEYGMSPLGPIQYEKDTGSVFLGRDYTSSQKNFSTQVAFEIDNAVRKIIDDAHEEAKRIIRERKEDVILLAETLLEQESITAEQIDYLLKHRTLKPETSLEKEEVKEIKEDDAKVEGTTTEE